MNAPMASGMKKEGMVLGDVAEMARQQEKCLDEIMKADELKMDEKQK